MRQSCLSRKLLLCLALVALIEVAPTAARRKSPRVVCEGSKGDLEAVNASSLDPTLFGSAEKGYKSLVESKPYGNFIDQDHQWVCVYHLLNFLMPACGNLQGNIKDPEVCCGSIRAMMNKGEGNCLCEPVVQSSAELLIGIFGLAQQLKCSIDFPIPDAQGLELVLAFRAREECTGFDEDYGTLENPHFLGLTPEEILTTPPQDLPTYADLYESPPPGPYKDTSYTIVNVTRPAPSILVNEYSSPETFSAIVVYPSYRAKETIDPTTGFSLDPVLADGFEKFPIVSFSPGFRTPPEAFLLMMSHLASHGMIVISQKSTEPVSMLVPDEASPAWANDMAYGLLHLSEEGSKKESFLYERTDGSRAAVAGHSFGGIVTYLVASTAVDLGINVQAIAALSPTCSPFVRICDTVAEANLKNLKNTRYLILSGKQDPVAPPSHAQYMASVATTQSNGNFDMDFRVLDNLNHCLVEFDPKIWPFAISCGRHELPPFEQSKEVHAIVGNFLVEALGAV